jgi:hypothetical protein
MGWNLEGWGNESEVARVTRGMPHRGLRPSLELSFHSQGYR